MSSVETTIVSIILMIGLGYFLKRINFLSDDLVSSLNKMVMNVLMPCMIFTALYSSDLGMISELGILPFVIIGSSIATGIISFIVLKKLNYSDKRLWSVLVAIMIANTAFIGYPVNLGIFGHEGFLRAIFCDIGTTALFLLLSAILMLKFGGTIKVALKKILLFPPLWALILGIALNMLNVPLGETLDSTLNYLADGAIPLIMISLGLALDFKGFRRSRSVIGISAVFNLIVYPLIAFAIVNALGLSGLDYTVGVIEAAMPSGMLSLLLAVTYKLDYELTSDCILVNTLISMVTLPVIITLL